GVARAPVVLAGTMYRTRRHVARDPEANSCRYSARDSEVPLAGASLPRAVHRHRLSAGQTGRLSPAATLRVKTWRGHRPERENAFPKRALAGEGLRQSPGDAQRNRATGKPADNRGRDESVPRILASGKCLRSERERRAALKRRRWWTCRSRRRRKRPRPGRRIPPRWRAVR